VQLKLLQRGDTIIEVMLAFTVFALLAVGTVTLMNRGVASAQDSLETTLVRQQVDGQVEALRFLYQSYSNSNNPASPTRASAKTFAEIVTKASTENASDYSSDACLNEIPGLRPFLIEPKSGTILESNLTVMNPTTPNSSAPAYAQIKYNDDGTLDAPYGMWIEAVQGGKPGQPQFIDFHIRACWFGTTGEAARKIGTVVRFYLPTVEKGQLVGVGTGIPQIASYAINGASNERCQGLNKNENQASDPFPPASVRPFTDVRAPGDCVVFNGASVFSCSNYDVQYAAPSQITSSGEYSATISYSDYFCQGSGTESLAGTPYEGYRVGIYVDGDLRDQKTLPTSESSITFDNIGTINPGSKVQLRWWNNHWVNQPSERDPDFMINQIRLTRIDS